MAHMTHLTHVACHAVPLILALLVVLCSQAAECALAPVYPNCPLTGKPPKKQTASTRCADASEYTCCDKCQDIRQSLGFVSANFSDVVQWAGIFPKELQILNNWINGTDSNTCTTFSTQEASPCANHIEQLACAMSCHPNSGDFVQQLGPSTYKLSVCKPYYFKFCQACFYIPVPGGKGGKLEQFAPYMPQWLNDLGNIAWGLSGLPEFHVVFSQSTGPPGCWEGMSDDFAGQPACCDALSTSTCPAPILELTKYPYFAKFANDPNATDTCRVGEDFQGSRIVAFSPPPFPPPASPPSSPPPLRTASPPEGGGNSPAPQGLSTQSLSPPAAGEKNSAAVSRGAPLLMAALLLPVLF